MSQPSTRPALYKGFRFPPEIISRCVWLYYRFGVSLRDVSELMLARRIEVSHEAIRLWTLRFGTEYARRLRRTRGACSRSRACCAPTKSCPAHQDAKRIVIVQTGEHAIDPRLLK